MVKREEGKNNTHSLHEEHVLYTTLRILSTYLGLVIQRNRWTQKEKRNPNQNHGTSHHLHTFPLPDATLRKSTSLQFPQPSHCSHSLGSVALFPLFCRSALGSLEQQGQFEALWGTRGVTHMRQRWGRAIVIRSLGKAAPILNKLNAVPSSIYGYGRTEYVCTLGFFSM